MKRALLASALLIASGTALVMAQAKPTAQADAGALPIPKSDRISMAEFKKLLAKGEVIVVDVRSEGNYAAGHIPGALSIPEGSINEAVAEKLKRLRKPVATYCS